MKLLFYHSPENGLESFSNSDNDYTNVFSKYSHVFKEKNVDGYCLVDSKSLPSTFDVNKDFSIIRDGYQGYGSDQYNIYVYYDQRKHIKATLFKYINDITKNKIEQGFYYRNNCFSLSPSSQSKYHFMYNLRATLEYPVYIQNADNTGHITLSGIEDVAEYYQSAASAFMAIINEDSRVKQEIVNAANNKHLLEVIESFDNEKIWEDVWKGLLERE